MGQIRGQCLEKYSPMCRSALEEVLIGVEYSKVFPELTAGNQ